MHCVYLFTSLLITSFISIEINAKTISVSNQQIENNNTKIIMQQKIHALKELDSIWFNTSHIIEKKLYSSKQPGKEVKMCEEKTSEEFVVPYRDAPSNIQYYMDKLSNVTEEKSMNIKTTNNNAELLQCFDNVIDTFRKSMTIVIENTIKCITTNSSH